MTLRRIFTIKDCAGVLANLLANAYFVEIANVLPMG